MKIALLVFTYSFMSFAQMLEGDLLEALDGSGWGKEYQSRSSNQGAEPAADPQIQGNRTSQDLDCNGEEERNTIPYKFLLGLLANRSLDISHDPHSGVLSLKGGVMIGNCQSMLETVVSKPNENIPYYTFQVAVKRPGGCDGDVCSYGVTKINNGENKKYTKSFKPSFAGFVDCLKDTGVYSDGKISQNKVAPVEFLHKERDITLTSEVVYANRGFKGTRYAGKYSTNKLPEYPGCYYFEDVKKDGFKTYSVDEMEDYELERLYQKVCDSGNYKLIDSHISDFDQLAPFQDGLVKIRNELILEEVKKLSEIVTEAEDLSEVDKAKFKEVTSDFLEHVVKPLKNDLAQLQRLYSNPGHSQKENILNSVFGPEKARALLGKDASALKIEIKKEMDKRASQLVDYARAPYLTKENYEKMTSKKAEAPIEDSTWTSAVLDLYEVHNTAFNYGRYSDDFWESHYQDNPAYKNEKRYTSGAKLDKKISSKMRKKRTSIKRVSEVAANPDVDYGANYERTKKTILGELDREIAKYRRKMFEAQRKIQTHCAQEKAAKFYINQNACVRDAKAQYEACANQIEKLMETRDLQERKYNAKIAEWNEARRSAGMSASSDTASDSNDSVSDSGSNQNPRQGFSFTPERAQPQINNQYSQQMQQMRWQMMQRQQAQNFQGQNFQQPPSYMPQMNNGIGLNFGIGMGAASQYGMTPPYNPMQYQQYYGRMPAGGQGQFSMNPAVSYMNNQYTAPGGAFNFGVNGNQGGQMWAGGTPGFYSPGGAGFQNGGAGNPGGGFSFGN